MIPWAFEMRFVALLSANFESVSFPATVKWLEKSGFSVTAPRSSKLIREQNDRARRSHLASFLEGNAGEIRKVGQ